MLPLAGVNVLEFPFSLAIRAAGLRLADLGANVISFGKPDSVYLPYDRNKTFRSIDEINEEELDKLVAASDIVLYDIRFGKWDESDLYYKHQNVIMGCLSGLGRAGQWHVRPCDDLVAQSLSGLVHLTGNQDDPPTPFPIPIAELLAGTHLVQGVLAALSSGEAALVQASLLESMIDFQFEVLTTHFADGGRLPKRSKQYNAHAYLSAPYGIYPTRDGHLALGMGNVAELGKKLGSSEIAQHMDSGKWFNERDLIQSQLAEHLKTKSAQEWLTILEPQDVWCAEVMSLEKLKMLPGYRVLQIDQIVQLPSGESIETTRCPVRIDGERLYQEIKTKDHPRIKSIAPRSESVSLLNEIVVLDFSQFLSGPCAGLRLADFGARVVKIEKPIIGDICRQLYVSDTRLDGESTTFHAINRNKESYCADLKTADGLEEIKNLITQADVLIHNFRPGVMERLGLSYDEVRKINSKMIYATITGYGEEGPWRDKPGQDLLVQAISGLAWHDGKRPMAMGLSVVDQMAGMYLVQGILSLLHRRNQTQLGGRVDVNMLETAIDLQILPKQYRSVKHEDCLSWLQLKEKSAFQQLQMIQSVKRGNGTHYQTTRCPITFNESLKLTNLGSPDLGEHTEKIKAAGLRKR